MPSIHIDADQVNRVKSIARHIATDIQSFIDHHSSISIERSVLRLFGVDGVDDTNTPISNCIMQSFRHHNLLENGVSKPFVAAMILENTDVQITAQKIIHNEIDFTKLYTVPNQLIDQKLTELTSQAIKQLHNSVKNKSLKTDNLTLPPQPWKYLIVATGNIYEDVTQAKSAVRSGADIIAVIRSTAQSLLDYVPYGASTEGFGGTLATQENFRIMRQALDDAGNDQNRYIRLVNYSSGLCMAEIAVCAAFEDLDMLLNDSMYGILFRDINMKRTFVDQYFSRLICAHAGIIINTGEDNYLTTSDAIDNAHTVTASQLINEAMGKNARLSDWQLGLGHAFEINPDIPNAFLYELAHASLAKALFPNAPLKFMPPTKYKRTDIFFSHALDTMFNLASITTGQGIHLAGILTEAIHTPLMQDRYQSLDSINYVFNTANALGDEIEFKKDGFIQQRAQTVLDQTESFLDEICNHGLMHAITEGKFADIKRPMDSGKGLDGVFKKGNQYCNPILIALEKEDLCQS